MPRPGVVRNACVSIHLGMRIQAFVGSSRICLVFSPTGQRLCPGRMALRFRRHANVILVAVVFIDMGFFFWSCFPAVATPTTFELLRKKPARRFELRLLRVFLPATALRRNLFLRPTSGRRRGMDAAFGRLHNLGPFYQSSSDYVGLLTIYAHCLAVVLKKRDGRKDFGWA